MVSNSYRFPFPLSLCVGIQTLAEVALIQLFWFFVLHTQVLDFYARQHIHVMIARICHANSVRPSVTRVYCIKTAERIIEILSQSDRPIILVFRRRVVA